MPAAGAAGFSGAEAAPRRGALAGVRHNFLHPMCRRRTCRRSWSRRCGCTRRWGRCSSRCWRRSGSASSSCSASRRPGSGARCCRCAQGTGYRVHLAAGDDRAGSSVGAPSEQDANYCLRCARDAGLRAHLERTLLQACTVRAFTQVCSGLRAWSAPRLRRICC